MKIFDVIVMTSTPKCAYKKKMISTKILLYCYFQEVVCPICDSMRPRGWVWVLGRWNEKLEREVNM